MKKLLLCVMAAGLALASCDNLTSKQSTGIKIKKPLKDDGGEPDEPIVKKKKVAEVLVTNSEGEIMNDVIVHEQGLTISKAYLAREDGSLVNGKNEAALNEAVYLNLVVDKGWSVKDGMVTLGASEKIVSDAGEVVVNVADVFADTPTATQENAGRIVLKAGITKTRPNIRYFIVNYRLWDKATGKDVRGSYKLYITREVADGE